jgi:hypothetical protein
MFANVVFPAFHAPYYAGLLPPAVVATLLVECSVMCGLNRPCKVPAVCLAVAASNLVSWLAGYLVVPLLFVGDGYGWEYLDGGGAILTHGRHWDWYASWAFLQACVLSIAIEYAALLAMHRWVPLRRRFLGVLVGNLASYAVLFAGVCCFVGSLASPRAA